VLVHGNTALGQKFAMYKVLASKLAEFGYVVLTYDQLGFGLSDNPFILGPSGAFEAYDRIQMANAAVQHLIGIEHVDKSNLTIIGHSGGAITALKAGLIMNEIRNIILIGPPRRIRERSKMAHHKAYHSERFRRTHRFVYGTPIPEWFTQDMTYKAGPWALEDYAEPFLMRGHKPLMLIDGEREKDKNKMYLERFYSALAEPKKFVRLRRSDHYCNTAQSRGLVFYDKGVMNELVDHIINWIEKNRKS
jgi:pimeloyl-ACP methyl ester carboxylesterase